MTDDGSGGRVPRRSVLRALGGGAALGGLYSGGAVADLADGTSARATGPDLRRPVERFGLGPLDAEAAGRQLADAQLADEDDLEHLEDKRGCFDPGERELYGPTDINAQSANGRLAVGISGEGTVTVFRWPRPSFFDQVKYYTRGRDDDDEIVVAPNQGAFLGVLVDTGGGPETSWLRDWDVREQRYENDREGGPAYSDALVTRFVHDDLGLDVRVRDVVPRDVDALVRNVRVLRRGSSSVERARLVAFENVNPVVGKVPQFPVTDWCLEELNDSRARYDDDADAIVHERAGADPSTGEVHAPAVAMGFAGESAGHQVGGDAHDPLAEPTAEEGPFRDAYDDASAGELSGNDEYVGQATGALSTDLSFRGANAETTLVVAAGDGADDAVGALESVRATDYDSLRRAKEEWIADRLSAAPLPAVGDHEDAETAAAIESLSRRALTTLVTNYDERSGAVVASISTQPPYGQDWPRDGAFFNYVLHLAGLADRVDARNRWYADIQREAVDDGADDANTPPGNWNMCYYGDGVAGGPIPYQIDTTGLVVWTLWDHYQLTGDGEYLEAVYPAIERSAEYLLRCRDPSNGLHCRSFEDDRFLQPDRQTVNGAIPAWLALRSARDAARERGLADDADRYAERMHELGRAIDGELYDAEEGAYGTKRAGFVYAETTWPACYTPYADPETGEIRDRPQVEDPLEHPRIRSHLTSSYRQTSPTFDEPEAGDVHTGQYEAKALIPLAKARRSDAAGDLEDVREGVAWLATEHATDDTRVMGEGWKVFEDDGDREVRSIIGQPHVWQQVLVYLAALEAYPPGDVDFEAGTCGSVLEALREEAVEVGE